MRDVEEGSSLLEREAHLLVEQSWARDGPRGGDQQLLLELAVRQSSWPQQAGLEVVPPLLREPAHLRKVAVAESEDYLLAVRLVPLQQLVQLCGVDLERVQLLTCVAPRQLLELF